MKKIHPFISVSIQIKAIYNRLNERFDDKWDFCALDRQDERILEFEKGEWMQTRALRIIKLRKV